MRFRKTGREQKRANPGKSHAMAPNGSQILKVWNIVGNMFRFVCSKLDYFFLILLDLFEA